MCKLCGATLVPADSSWDRGYCPNVSCADWAVARSRRVGVAAGVPVPGGALS